MALLRMALAAMGQHDAGFHPWTYAVFYEHVAGINPGLNLAMAEALSTSARLDDATVERLYRAHVAEVGADEAERIQGDMQRVMSDIVESAARTGEAAGAFGEQLEQLNGALDKEPDSPTLGPQVQSARVGTVAMRDSVSALQNQVTQSQREIEQLRADLLRSREEATLCPLTKILNRRGFEQRLDAMLQQRPAPGSAHCLILLDIDHFKRVNDTHGHPVGDKVLEGVGAVLRSVPLEPGMACARWGGEEFAILLPGSNLNKAVQLAEAVRTRTRGIRLRNRATQAVELTITLSAGVAAWHPGDSAADLVHNTDQALYRAKANGRDRVLVA